MLSVFVIYFYKIFVAYASHCFSSMIILMITKISVSFT
jgi:hypothetical protein